MKNLLLFAFILLQACAVTKDSVLVLKPSQSMCITGKGPGQDGAINPYLGEKSVALVKNLSENSFNVRIQKAGKIIKDVTIQPHKKQQFVLLKGQELYFDSQLAAKAHIRFKKYKG
ncbi:hypothetical protein BKI52_06195 [marine bacterium AO1-C]|nr:hypothetical protein BKI52_06195 [marine bacterium AO1-C]